jgi:hypothetical protein
VLFSGKAELLLLVQSGAFAAVDAKGDLWEGRRVTARPKARRIPWLNRLLAALGSVCCGMAALAAPAAASVTIGQLASAPSSFCNGPNVDRVQPTVTSGASYVVPEEGTIASWSFNAASGAGQIVALKVFRKVDQTTYTAVGHDGPRNIAASQLNTFPTNIQVKPGDVLGTYIPSSSANTACVFSAPGDSFLYSVGNLGNGDSGVFASSPDNRLNVSAVFDPQNTFTVGATVLNKQKGTATLTLTLPNPGELTGSGNGVRAASAQASKAVGAGPAKLFVNAKGKKKRKLNDTGKVKLNVTITYVPQNGAAGTQTVVLKLKKKL